MRSRRLGTLVLLLLTGVLGACGGGGSNTEPGVVFNNLGFALMVMVGGTVQVDYTDDDPDSAAMTSFVADRDGDLLTTADQETMAVDRPELDGTAQSFFWNTAGVTPGIYRIFAIITDGSTIVIVEAVGRVTVNDVSSFSPGNGTALRGTAYNLRVAFLFPLLNPVLTQVTMPVRVGGVVIPGSYAVENQNEVVFTPASCVFAAPFAVQVEVLTTVGATGAAATVVDTANFTTAISPVWAIGSASISEVDPVNETEDDDFPLGMDDDPWFGVCSRGGLLYLSNRGNNVGDGDIIVFNTLTGAIASRIALAETDPLLFTIPAGIRLSADESTLYVAVFEADGARDTFTVANPYLVVIDVASGTETNRIPLNAPDSRVRNLILAVNALRAYVTGYDAQVIHVVDLLAGVEVDTDGDAMNGITPMPLSEAKPAGLEMDATGAWLYVSHAGGGTTTDITTVDTAAFTEGTPLTTTANANSGSPDITRNPCDGWLYVPHVNHGGDEGISVFDTAGPTTTVVDTTGGSGYNRGVAFVLGTTIVAVGDRDAGDVLILDSADLAAGVATVVTSTGSIVGLLTIPPMRY